MSTDTTVDILWVALWLIPLSLILSGALRRLRRAERRLSELEKKVGARPRIGDTRSEHVFRSAPPAPAQRPPYECPACGSNNPNAYVMCMWAGCPDGRDPR